MTSARTLFLTKADGATDLHPVRKGFYYFGTGFGLLLAIFYEYATANYTFVQTKNSVYNSKPLGGCFAALTVMSTAYIVGLSIMRTSQRIFNFVGNCITKNETRNLSWQLRPKLASALATIGLTISLAALAPNYIIWHDFYSKNAIQCGFFEYGVCTALFLLFFTSKLDIIDDIVISRLHQGSEEEKAIVQMSATFKQLISLVEQCPDDILLDYLQGSEGVRDQLSLSNEQLRLVNSSYGSIV